MTAFIALPSNFARDQFPGNYSSTLPISTHFRSYPCTFPSSKSSFCRAHQKLDISLTCPLNSTSFNMKLVIDDENGYSNGTTETATPSSSLNSSTTETLKFPKSSKALLEAVGVGEFNLGGHKLKIYSGSSNEQLAHDVARYVGKKGCNEIMRKKFADGELYVRIGESVRGCNVFLIQSTCNPVNDNLLELLLMIDACRRAHAHQVTVVVPYYGYARADRLIDPDAKRREALTSKLVSNMICEAGADRIVVVDIHSPQTCGFFDIPLDHIYASKVIVEYLREKKLGDDLVVVAPDVGGVARARAFAKALNDVPLAIIDKRREAHNVAKVLNVVGDVSGKTCVIVDDMIDTAGTITEGARVLKSKGARQVFAACTHPVFSGPAIARLSSGDLEEVIVTDTIHLPPEKQFPQLRILSVAPLLGETIWNLHEQLLR